MIICEIGLNHMGNTKYANEYIDANELLAVAKLSKPLNKDFTKEALIRVKLDF